MWLTIIKKNMEIINEEQFKAIEYMSMMSYQPAGEAYVRV